MGFDGSYPAPPGNKHFSLLDKSIAGAYTAITPGTPPTGGVSVNASEFGLSAIEWAQCVGSDDGTYDGVVYMAPFVTNRPSPAIRVQVVTAATGAQATGTIAAGRTMRILAMGW